MNSLINKSPDEYAKEYMNSCNWKHYLSSIDDDNSEKGCRKRAYNHALENYHHKLHKYLENKGVRMVADPFEKPHSIF